MTAPTLGRVVWFISDTQLGAHYLDNTPFTASVAFVHESEGKYLVNLGYFDHLGFARSVSKVPFFETPEEAKESGFTHFATWMPYQREQAAKMQGPQVSQPVIPPGSPKPAPSPAPAPPVGADPPAKPINAPHRNNP